MECNAQDYAVSATEVLLMCGADPTIEDDLGRTPLCIAAEKNDLQMIEIIFFNGGDINHVLKKGKFEGGTVLHFAATCANEDTVRLLIDLGGDIHSKDWRGRTPLHWAAREGSASVMELLLEMCGGDLYLTDNNDLTLLHLAAAGGNVETMDWLIEIAKMDLEVKDCTGWTPLHRAAESGQVSTIAKLLEKGAYIQATTKHGSAPLHFAALRGHIDAVKLLIEKGAPINARDNFTWTALQMALTNNYNTVAEYLRSMGAQPGGSVSGN